MKVIKKLNPLIAPHLTHLFNSMKRTGIYPKILKTSRIIPLLKPDKSTNEIAGYRTINILGPIDKLYQQHPKDNMTAFFIPIILYLNITMVVDAGIVLVLHLLT